MNIYGLIGYTILENDKHKLLLISDRHDKLPKNCNNPIDISSWFKKKWVNNEILLEEVPRIEGINLKELWEDSEHTQKLKKLYLDNSHIIKPIDIRPFLLSFSWEVMDNEQEKILMKDYLLIIDHFFSFKHPLFELHYNKIIKNKKIIYHFMIIKRYIYKKLVIDLYKNNLLNKSIIDVKNNNLVYLEKINDLLDYIMEWFICYKIVINDKNKIIHIGLVHSSKVLEFLEKHYNYKIRYQKGINKIGDFLENDINGCLEISEENNSLFS